MALNLDDQTVLEMKAELRRVVADVSPVWKKRTFWRTCKAIADGRGVAFLSFAHFDRCLQNGNGYHLTPSQWGVIAEAANPILKSIGRPLFPSLSIRLVNDNSGSIGGRDDGGGGSTDHFFHGLKAA